MISGNSGVGKSTFINALEPEINLKTASISSQHMQENIQLHLQKCIF